MEQSCICELSFGIPGERSAIPAAEGRIQVKTLQQVGDRVRAVGVILVDRDVRPLFDEPPVDITRRIKQLSEIQNLPAGREHDDGQVRLLSLDRPPESVRGEVFNGVEGLLDRLQPEIQQYDGGLDPGTGRMAVQSELPTLGENIFGIESMSFSPCARTEFL